MAAQRYRTIAADLTPAEAWEALNDLDGRALFTPGYDYEDETDKLMAIIAADPSERGAAVVLWRLSHAGWAT